MENDVCVAVTGKTAWMRYFHAAEHDRTFAEESMDIETHSRAWTQAAGKPLLCSVEIRRRREFVERGIAFDGGYPHSCCANGGCFVRRCSSRPARVSLA